MTKPNSTLAAAAVSALLCGLTPSHAQQATPAAQAAPAQQANAADACQAAPKGAAPQGKHWYYRTDRSANRKCWYLADAGMKTTATQRAAPPSKASSPDAETATPPTAQQNPADARAEIPQPAIRSVVPMPQSATTPKADSNSAADTSEPAQAQTQGTSSTINSAPLLTENWPDASAFRPSGTVGAATPLANSPPAESAANSEIAPPPAMKAAVAVPPAMPETAAPSDQSGSLASWRTILGALFIALGLAGILGFVTFRYLGPARAPAPRKTGARRDLWGNSHDETVPAFSSYDQMVVPSRWASASLAPSTPQDLDEIEQLLRRAAREPDPDNVIALADPAIRARTPTTQSAVRASAVRHAGSSRLR